MTASCLLLGSTTLGWYMGIVLLDVVRGARVLDKLMSNILHVRTFVQECTTANYSWEGNIQLVYNDHPDVKNAA
jgi:hypothetical protein